MSGHSKWSTIKRKKGAKDAQRSRAFSKVIKEIVVAARLGGGDPDGNPRLRLAIGKARAANMPQDNIKRAIQKGTGELEGVHYEEIVYEAFGPGGVAMLIETLTDNRNRTVMDVRHVLDRHGGHLAQTGAVSHLFTTAGCVTVAAAGTDEERVLATALDSGALDTREDGEHFLVMTAPADLDAVGKAFEAAGMTVVESEIVRVPSVTVPLSGAQSESVLRLVDLLEDLDDVQTVSANFD